MPNRHALTAGHRLPRVPVNGFRLTLTSGTPITTSDVSSSATVYCTPALHNVIELPNPTNPAAFDVYESAEFSVALGTLTSGLPYDVFAYAKNGGPALDTPLAWSSATSRATALALTGGRWAKSTDLTRLYLGTFYTSSTTTTADTLVTRYLFNHYNRALRKLEYASNASHVINNVAVREWNADTSARTALILGLADQFIQHLVQVTVTPTATAGVQFGSTYNGTLISAFTGQMAIVNTVNLDTVATGSLSRVAAGFWPGALGWSYFSISEREFNSQNCTMANPQHGCLVWM